MTTQLAAFVFAGGLVAASASAQTPPANPPATTAPCSVAPQPVPCGSSPVAKPKTADPFAFPGETDAPASPATPAAPAPAANPRSDAPQVPGLTPRTPVPTGAAGRGLTGLDFPDEDTKPAITSDGSSSSSSSSNGGSSVSDPDPDAPSNASPDPKDKGTDGAAPTGRRLLHRVNPIGTKLQNADEREAEDLDIAHFYMQSGNLQGAYLRSQDAVKTAPEDPDAHFALGEAARKLNKRDEAIAEYAACLKFDPEEKQAKAAQKELARLKQ